MSELKRNLSLFDATALAIGAIVGAGIFVISGVAAGLAGPAVILSIIIAGVVSSFTAYSFVRLSSKFAEEGGPYVYAKNTISRFAGFITGWLWLFANIVAGATVSLGLASYVSSLLPILPIVPIAISSILILVILNIVGIKQSSIFNAVLVILKLSALSLFIVIGFSHLNFSLYEPFSPNGIKGVLSSAALIFFAYTGFGRPATAAEEIKDPKHTVPRSIVIALILSSIVYILVGIVSTGLIPYQKVANSGSPITDAIEYGIKIYWLKIFVSFAAIVATVSVLLTTIIGVSRVSFAMARDDLLPKVFSKMHKKFSTPYLAILITGIVMAILPLFGNLKQTANVTNFGSLLVYAIVNFTGMIIIIKDPQRLRRYLVIIPALGLVSCAALLYFLAPISWMIGISWISVGCAYYVIIRRHQKTP